MKFPFFQNTKKASDLKKELEKEKEQMEQIKGDIISASGVNVEKSVYKYFDMESIIDSLNMDVETAKKAGGLIKNSSIRLVEVTDGANPHLGNRWYDDEYSAGYGTALASVSGKENAEVRIEFTKKKIQFGNCNCKKCRLKNGGFRYRYSEPEYCEHVVATVFLVNAYLETHELGDETNYSGNNLLSYFDDREEVEPKKLKVMPKLVFDRKRGPYSKLYLQFKMGYTKLLQIKKYNDFVDALENRHSYPLGKNNTVELSRNAFDEESKPYVKFMEDLVNEEFLIRFRYSDYFSSKLNSSRIEVDGSNIDRVYELLAGKKIDFTLETSEGNINSQVEMRDRNEHIAIKIDPIYEKNVFAGIELETDFPDFIWSNNYMYGIGNEFINRCDVGFMEVVKPLMRMEDEYGSISIGRKNIGRFYNSVLPRLENYAVITNNAPEALQFIPEKGRITFYFDMEDDNAVARLDALYNGGRVDIITGKVSERNEKDLIRNFSQEEKALAALKAYMPHTDERGFLTTRSDDEMYLLKSEGIDALNKFGKVLGSDDFHKVRFYKSPNASIGVSVQSNLLKLDLLSKDITPEELVDIVSSYRKKKKYYRLKSGAFVDMNSEYMSNFNEMLNVLEISPKDLRTGALTVPLYRSIYINEMMEAHEELVEKRDESFAKLVEKFDNIKTMNFAPPKEVESVLRPYQKEGYRWLRMVEELGFGGILADDMGLGKTLQTISMLIAAKKEGRFKKALIVCPASLVYNWSEELAKFDVDSILSVSVLAQSKEEREKSLEEFKDDVYISSYDTLRRDISLYHNKIFSHQIIDEAQFIKNQTTGVAKAVKAVRAEVKFALTGTPIENRLSELWSIFDYVMPGFLYNYSAFKSRYESLIVKEGNEDITKLLSRMISPFVLRRLKSQVALDLPEKIEEIRVSKFEKKQQLSYDAELAKLKMTLEGDGEYNSSKIQILAQITRLRQICCDPALVLENYNGGSAKLDTCIDLLKSGIEAGHKILLFSQFTSMLDIIENRLNEEGISYYVITGSTSKEKRLELVNSFNNDDTNVFLISLKAGGTGLNLVGADIVIHYDPWWNFAAQNQATDRAHRIGQKNMVTVYRLIAKGTIEERIVGLQESKRDLADKVLNFEEGMSLSTISKEELIELLG